MLKYQAHPKQLDAWLKLQEALDLLRQLDKDLSGERLGKVISDHADASIREGMRALASFREHDFKADAPKVKKTVKTR